MGTEKIRVGEKAADRLDDTARAAKNEVVRRAPLVEAPAEPGGEEDEPLVAAHAPEPGRPGRRGLGADGGPEAHPARGGAAGSPGACTSSINCPSGSTMKQAADWDAGKRIAGSSSTRSPAARSG